MRTQLFSSFSSFLLVAALALAPALTGCDDPKARALTSPAQAAPTLTLAKDAYTGFLDAGTGKDAIQHMTIATGAAVSDRLYSVNGNGEIQVLDLDGTGGTVAQVAKFDVATSLGSLVPSRLSIFGDSAAVLTTSVSGSATDTKVFLFDPVTARSTSDVVASTILAVGDAVDRGRTFAYGDGTASTVTSFEPNFPAGSRIVWNPTSGKHRLYVATSNLDLSFAGKTFPGTVLVFDVDLVNLTVDKSTRSVIWTSGYNPQTVDGFRDAKGKEYLLVVNSGHQDFSAWPTVTAANPGSVDVIDPATETVVGTIPLGWGNPTEIAVAADGKRAFLGSGTYSELYEIDLDDIGPELGGPPPAILYQRALHTRVSPIPVPSLSSSGQSLDVALSQDGSLVFVLNFNSSELSVIDLQRPGRPVVKQMQVRPADASGFGNNVQFVEVRPGRSGLNYQGPQVYLGSIALDAGQAPNGNKSAIETIEVTR